MLAKSLTQQVPHPAQERAAMNAKRAAVNAEQQRDLALVGRIARGDEPAFRALYAAYGQRMYAYALRLTGLPQTAEDVLQDSLVVVWKMAGRYRGQGRVRAWLLGIVHHTAMKALRYDPQPITEAMETSLASPAASPEERLQQAEGRQRLREGLGRLSPEQRAALELVFYQELSLKEAAQVCGCPVGTIKSRLSYARKTLRGMLGNAEELR